MTDTPNIDSDVVAQSSRTAFPPQLRDADRWMVWKQDEGRKIPRAPHKGDVDLYASAMDEENWMAFERAKKYVDMVPSLSGLTFTLQNDDGLTLMDYDDVRDPETGEILPVVMDHIERIGGFAQVSTSGTGVHLIIEGSLPERMKSLVIDLDGHEDAELEIYDGDRFIAMTGDVLDESSTDIADGQALLDDLVDEHEDTSANYKPGDDAEDWEPSKDREEIEATEKTSNIEDIFDAIKHTTLRDIRLRSEMTEGENASRKSFDPSWEQSDSGTRLGYEDGAWIYRKGNVGLDALQVVALEEHTITDPSEYPSGEDFWSAVEELRNRGAPIPEFEYDPDARDVDPMATLPLARLDAMSHDERVRYAKNRGIEWPDVEEVQDRLNENIVSAVRDGEVAVKSAPTGSGKTYTVSTKEWKSMPDVTNDKPVIHAHRTHEARDQARQMSDEAGVDAYTLKGRKELCPVAAGDYDPDNDHENTPILIDGQPISEWIDHRCDRQGFPFSHVHRWAEEEVDGDLPCQEGDTECAALGQFDGIPRDDDGNPSHDVIHTTHQFLLVPSLRMHTNVFIDEKPAFGINLEADEVRESVNVYLDYIDAPVSSYSELVRASETGLPPNVGKGQSARGLTSGELKEAFANEMEEALNGENTYVECPKCEGEGDLSDDENETLVDGDTDCQRCNGTGEVVENRGEPPVSWYKQNPQAHALAPAFARAVWRAEEAAGDRKHARIPYRPPRWGNEEHDESAWNRVIVDVVLDDQYEVVEVESIPDFTLAESVIGLDAHPQPDDPYWMANVHPDIETDYTLDTEERTLYRRYERGLFTVQVGDGVQPVTSGEWLDEGQGKKFDAIVEQLRDHYGEDFDSAITSISAEGHIRQAMEEAGVEDPEMMHYGNEESRNDFAGKNVGLVVGSIDPGDHRVVNLLARLGMDAEPTYKECPVCEGTGNVEDDDGNPEMCETCTGRGEVRERGRTFEGEDADIADAVLKGVREHHVAQSAGRWARDAEDPEDNATVFIVTEAAPTGFIDAHAPGVTWTTNEDQRERLEYVRDQSGGATAKEVAEATDCSKKAAYRTLRRAEEEGLLEKTPGVGPYGADVYAPSDAFSPNGAVDLDAAERGIAPDDVMDNSTFTISIRTLPHCALTDYADEKDDWKYQSSFEWFAEGSGPPT